MGIITAIKKYHKYIYGKKFTLVTDHLLLKFILHPDKAVPTLSASRLQRWSLTLSSYQYKIKYKKSCEIGNADALSRLPLEQPTEEPVYSFSTIYDSPITALDIVNNTKQDAVLIRVLEYTKRGWPNKVHESLKPYFTRRNELTCENNCLLWGNRVIIPFNLRENVLELLHSQHIGLTRMKMLARSEVWWPNLDFDLDNFIRKCEPCQLLQTKSVSVPLTPWSRTNRVWQRVHIDFFEKFNHYFMILVDSYSRWLEVHLIASTSAFNTIDILRKICSTFGFPEEIVSDNGPPFNGENYRKFCMSHGIKCTLTPPLHPCSNGLAEKYVGTVKSNLIKQLKDNQLKGVTQSLQHQVDNFLFSYRNTPNSITGVSPASFVLKQTPRNKLSLLKPTFLKEEIEKVRLDKVKNYEDRKRNKMRQFYEGQNVIVYDKRIGKWQKGKIVKVISLVTYLVIVNDQVRYFHADYIKDSILDMANSQIR